MKRPANPGRRAATSATLESLAPADPIMLGAWLSALHWGIGHAETVAQFRADTGSQWEPAHSPIAQMVDAATGAEGAFVLAFARWFNANVWGEVEGRAGSGDEGEGGEA